MRADLGDLWWFLIGFVRASPQRKGLESSCFAAVCLNAGHPVCSEALIPHTGIALALIVVQFTSSNPHLKFRMTAN